MPKRVEVAMPVLPSVLVKDLQDDEVICETCGGLGLVVEPHRFGLKADGKSSHMFNIYDPFPYKKEVLWPCPNCYSGVRHVCPHCGEAVKWMPTHRCEGIEKARRDEEAAKEAERFAKTEKISVEEAANRGIEYLWDDSDEVLTLDDACDKAADDEEDGDDACERPIGYYAARVSGRLGFDVDHLLENTCSDLHEGAYDQIGTAERKELETFLDAWAAKITGTQTYEPDYKVFVEFKEAKPHA